jgi:hypothetical protein
MVVGKKVDVIRVFPRASARAAPDISVGNRDAILVELQRYLLFLS